MLIPDSQLEKIIDKAIERHANAIHADCPFISEDIVFIRTWRKRLEKTAQGIGMAVILAILGGITALITMGLTVWKSQP